MITASLLSGVEFYVVAVILAAAVIALCVRPSGRGEARVHMLAGILCSNADRPTDHDSEPAPAVTLQCLDDGTVLLTRTGLGPLTDSGALSLVVTVTGLDIDIAEKLTAGKVGDTPVDTALFTLDFLAPERYHLRYHTDHTDRMAAFTLHNRPGIAFTRQLV